MPMKTLCIFVLAAILTLLAAGSSLAQCCAVGGGNPLAGDGSIGVLAENQFEFNANYQYVNTGKFLTEDKPDDNFLKQYSSSYLFTRFAYGLSERLTMSVEMGYWLDKHQEGLRERDTYRSNGIGDLILFPRYNIIKAGGHNRFTELSFGLGIKIPMGSYNDSIGHLEPFSGETFYTVKPLAVQASSGAQDVLVTLFYSRLIPGSRLKLSASGLYILKGWNPQGEKLGNYASMGIFVSRSFFEALNLSLQFKGEWISSMQINPDLLMVSVPNYDPEATGSRKFFVSPQLSYLFANRLTAFAQSEIPVYQYVNKTQIASQIQITFGLIYRFMLPSKAAEIMPAS